MGRLRALWRGYRGLSGKWQAGIAAGVVLLLAAVGGAGVDDEQPIQADARPAATSTTSSTTTSSTTTTSTTAPTTTTTTLITASALPDGDDAVVRRVVDGDTLELQDGRTVRLIGVDTPETKHPSQPVGCLGPEATAYTGERFPAGTGVRLVYDVERTDRYDRDLVYLYRAEDAIFLNLQLVTDGFAQVATYPPNVAHVGDFTDGQTVARQANRGLWGPVCASPPTTVATAGTPFQNCTAAREAGAAPVRRDDPGYGPHLDRDGDGIGCE